MRGLYRLLPYVKEHRWLFAASIGVMFVSRVFEGLIPFFLRRAIDDIANGIDALAVPALVILGCVVGRFLTLNYSQRTIRSIALDVCFDLRNRIYAHLQRQGSGFFARFSTGDLMARAINDIQLVRRFIAGGARMTIALVFSALVGLGFMLYTSPALTLFVLPPLPIISLVAYWFARRIYRRTIAVQEGFSTLSERAQENFNGIRTIQALGQEDSEIDRFEEMNERYARDYHELVRSDSLVSSWMPTLASIAVLTIIGYGGSLVLAGEMTIGAFAAFFLYMNMLIWPVRRAGFMVSLWQRGAGAMTRLTEVLDYEPEISDLVTGEAPPRVAGEIEINHLVYRYPAAEENALDDLSFHVRRGETIAILGRVGSGKSTLLKAIVRLVDPPAGSVRLDGRELHDYPLSQLRREVALVPQDPFLFAESLRGNLSYDEPERPVEPIWDAAEAADLKDTILELPHELATRVGERGVTLSGGQKQRATLARGFVREAPILLLDDCFSSVDTETEEHILAHLTELRRGRTTLLVSHRVSTARHADRILVLEKGRIAETGPHRELLDRGGVYASLAEAQSLRGRLVAELGDAKPSVPVPPEEAVSPEDPLEREDLEEKA